MAQHSFTSKVLTWRADNLVDPRGDITRLCLNMPDAVIAARQSACLDALLVVRAVDDALCASECAAGGAMFVPANGADYLLKGARVLMEKRTLSREQREDSRA